MMEQILYVIRQLHYNIYLVYKFQPAIMNECKVIHKQTYDKDLHSVNYSKINFNLFSWWSKFYMWSVNYTIISTLCTNFNML